jgi:hypothetical protein
MCLCVLLTAANTMTNIVNMYIILKIRNSVKTDVPGGTCAWGTGHCELL